MSHFYTVIACFIVALLWNAHAVDMAVKKSVSAIKKTCPAQKGSKLAREYWAENTLLGCDFAEWEKYSGTTKACWAIEERK